jgi:glycosyltransferase involved in cell wall biosynthesis
VNGREHKRIVVLQSCGFDHFLAATRAVAARYPCAAFVGLVRESDCQRARASGAFAEVHRWDPDSKSPDLPSHWNTPVDLCVVPFESRLGVYYWRFRLIPITHKLAAVASYNGRGQLREWTRLGWILNSLVISVGLRSVHKWALWAWIYLRRWLDVVVLFLLAGSALGLHGLRMLGRLLFDLKSSVERQPTGRLRVVLFILSLGVGGTQKQLVTFLQHLDRDRVDVELVMLDMPDKFFEPAVRSMGVPIIYLNRDHEFWMSGVVWRLMRHLQTRPCHVLHGWLHQAAALGSIAGRLAGVPIVIGSLRSERPGRFPWFYSWWQRGLDVLSAPLHTILIANSEAVREENRKWAFIPKRKLLTIYNGISTDNSVLPNNAELDKLRSDLNLPVGAPLVGIVGRLWPEKDHATFLKASQLIGQTRPEAQFLIVGDGNLRQWIESEIVSLGLAGSVQLLGNRKDAPALIQLLDVLVLTSTSEGFPNVLLEAAVVDTAVVTTAAGGATEVVLNGETGFVVPCGDAEAVAGRVLELLADADLRKRLAGAARERIRTCFSADRTASAIQSLYERDWRRSSERASVRPLRVCFISTHAYGLLKPSSGLPVGGAEVQTCTLARELAHDPRFEVTMLTGHQGREGRECEGPLTIVLDSVFAKLQATVGACSGAGSTGAGSEAGGGRLTFTERVRRWLSDYPSGLVAVLRGLVRGFYACRQRLDALFMPPVRWLVHRAREGRECVCWLRLLRSIDADVYVMRCACPQVGYLELACAVLHRKLVYMVAHEDEVSGRYAKTYGVWGKRFEWGLRRADAIVCQHADQVALLRSHYRRDARVVRSLCPRSDHSRAAASRKTILWISRMDDWKQPELLIELAARMPREAFVMVGPPSESDPEALPRLLARLDDLPNLRWRERIPFEETFALFAEAKVFVNTSRAEGFPNTFLQAAACGTPIVSWAVNPEGILDRYQIGYCAEQDWTRFEDCIRRLCTDATLRARMGENGRRYVWEHHDPVAIAAEYADLFFNLRHGDPRMSKS